MTVGYLLDELSGLPRDLEVYDGNGALISDVDMVEEDYYLNKHTFDIVISPEVITDDLELVVPKGSVMLS